MVHDKHNKDLGVAAYDKAPGKKKDSKKGWKHMRPITCFAAGKVKGRPMTWGLLILHEEVKLIGVKVCY